MSNFDTLAAQLKAITPNGHIAKMTTRTPVKVKASCPLSEVEKVTAWDLRFQAYKSVKAKATDTPQSEVEVQASPWNHHVSSFVVAHNKTGQLYFGVKPEWVTKSEYLVHGQLATPEQITTIKAHLTKRGKAPLWITVKMENIVQYAGENFSYHK